MSRLEQYEVDHRHDEPVDVLASIDPRYKLNPDAERHQQLLSQLHETYLQKNTAYGDSFHRTYSDLGIISAIVRISDKYNRAKTLAKDRTSGEIDTGDESIIDTLLDMANYCIMTVMEIEKES